MLIAGCVHSEVIQAKEFQFWYITVVKYELRIVSVKAT